MSERARRIEEIVETLLSIDEGERAAEVARACGADEPLRDDVVRRLDAYLSAPRDAWKPEVGSEILKYTLEERLGHGSYGEVWKVFDKQLERCDALKILYATGGLVDQALEEARATSLVRDPHVVHVYDAGVIGRGGRAYIVMELCGDQSDDDPRSIKVAEPLGRAAVDGDGSPLLSPLVAANYIMQASLGVQSVHRLGVYHRDIKPDNLLLTPKGMIKVSDFGLGGTGLARPPGSETTATSSVTISTQRGQVCGTPAYMCPEQARSERPTPLFDVYGLGATLYYLLAGTPPYQADANDSKDPASEILAKVLSDSPRPLSACGRALPEELVAICDKAMSRDPSSRYGSPGEMAKDLENWLSRRPTQALPSGRVRRLYLWYRRNALPASLGAGAVFFLVAGTVTSTLFGLQADYRRGQAENATFVANAEKKDAQELFHLASQALNNSTNEIVHNDRLLDLDAEDLRKDLLRSGLPFYLELVKRRRTDSELRTDQAAARSAYGQILAETGSREDAIVQFEAAREAFESLAREHPEIHLHLSHLGTCYYNLGAVLIAAGKTVEGERNWKKADEIWTDLFKTHPEVPEYETQLQSLLLELQGLYGHQGREHDAEIVGGRLEEYQRQHPVDDQNLAEFQKFLKELSGNLELLDHEDTKSQGFKHIKHSEDFLEGLRQKYPASPRAQEMSARAYLELVPVYVIQNQLSDARRVYDRLISTYARLVEAHPKVGRYRDELFKCYLAQADLYMKDDRVADGRRFLKKGIVLAERMVRDSPGQVAPCLDLVRADSALGKAEQSAGRLAESEAAYRAARDAISQLAHEHPDNLTLKDGHASANLDLARACLRLNRRPDALSLYRDASDIYRQLVAAKPDNDEYLRGLGRTQASLGELYSETGGKAPLFRMAATTAYDQSREALQKLVGRGLKGGDREDRVQLARVQTQLGLLYRESNRPRDAEKAFQHALKMRETTARGGGGPGDQAALAQGHVHLGNLYRDTRRFEPAEASYREALSILGPLVEDNKTSLESRYLYDMAALQVNMSFLYEKTGRPELAIDVLMRAVKAQHALVARFPERPDFAVNYGGGLVNLGHWERTHGSPEKALDWYDRGVKSLEKTRSQLEDDPKVKLFLRNAHWGRAEAHALLGHHADSLRDWDQALALNEKDDQFDLRSGRAKALAVVGDHAGAITETTELARMPNLKPVSFYELARIASVAAAAAARDERLVEAERGDKKRACSVLAINLLTRSAESGLFKSDSNLKELESDKVFDILRDQPEYKLLIINIK